MRAQSPGPRGISTNASASGATTTSSAPGAGVTTHGGLDGAEDRPECPRRPFPVTTLTLSTLLGRWRPAAGCRQRADREHRGGRLRARIAWLMGGGLQTARSRSASAVEERDGVERPEQDVARCLQRLQQHGDPRLAQLVGGLRQLLDLLRLRKDDVRVPRRYAWRCASALMAPAVTSPVMRSSVARRRAVARSERRLFQRHARGVRGEEGQRQRHTGAPAGVELRLRPVGQRGGRRGCAQACARAMRARCSSSWRSSTVSSLERRAPGPDGCRRDRPAHVEQHGQRLVDISG